MERSHRPPRSSGAALQISRSDPLTLTDPAVGLDEVAARHATRLALVAMLAEAPTGLDGLSHLLYSPATAGT